ncbi:MAG: DNA primase [Asgard group archaeon]|nr:DNA primase [Asgard group archaeon]
MADNNNVQSHAHEDSPTTKYMIYADFIIDGLVEKPDVVGALFGQTEGLLSEELELRELQKGGRVGRIQVKLTVRGGKTKGSLSIPSSLDKVETSILAAAIETVDRIGPCNAKISIKNIEDIRIEKMKKIRERASELLQKWNTEAHQDSSELADEVLKAARVGEIGHYGPLPAGPELVHSDTIIVVEGRADIAACLRAGVRNTIAVDGASVPKQVSDLTKKKTTIAFLDGDRGGDLILKELLMYSDIDYVARAPSGKEVEDLKPDEIIEQLSKKLPIEKSGFITDIHATDILEKAIKRKIAKNAQKDKAEPLKVQPPISQPPVKKESDKGKQPVQDRKPPPSRGKPQQSRPQSRSGPRPSYTDSRRQDSRRTSSRDRNYDRRSSPPPREPIPEELTPIIQKVDGKEKQQGIFLDNDLKELKTVSVDKIYDELKDTKGVSKVVFDGVVTQRLVDLCQEKEIEIIIGAKTAEITKPAKVKVFTFA